MIVYLDTSAVVPILIAEPGSDACRRVWRDADRLVSSRLTVVETGAALAMAQRQGRITTSMIAISVSASIPTCRTTGLGVTTCLAVTK